MSVKIVWEDPTPNVRELAVWYVVVFCVSLVSSVLIVAQQIKMIFSKIRKRKRSRGSRGRGASQQLARIEEERDQLKLRAYIVLAYIVGAATENLPFSILNASYLLRLRGELCAMQRVVCCILRAYLGLGCELLLYFKVMGAVQGARQHQDECCILQAVRRASWLPRWRRPSLYSVTSFPLHQSLWVSGKT